MSNLAVVVVGYNRIQGMLRLLDSLEKADYGDDRLTLIVSLDNSGNDKVRQAAEAFAWSHGEKIVRTFPERQGLRKHILACGDYLQEYDAIAVLEDDIVVSPAYYHFMKQAFAYYRDDDRVAGISLYTHRTNVNTSTPFIPAAGVNDVFFLQFAQSWGQVWMKKQWMAFKAWYEQNQDAPIEGPDVPEYVSAWPKTSWLKYHIKYCIETDKYFVYPYDSLTTCFSDVGEHCTERNSFYQVPMLTGVGRQYRLCRIQDGCMYDAFFERQGLGKYLGLPEEAVSTDLYGAKGNREHRRYVLTQRALPFRKVRGFALTMRPHEDNVIYGIEGDDICLYDTSAEGPAGRENDYLHVSYYYNLTAGIQKTTKYLLTRLKQGVSKKIRRK